MDSPEHERRAIVDYYLSQSSEGSEVTHAEKIASERSLGREHDVWDVHATDGRWWVITQPTNLYFQDHFPSMDMALTFHLGLAQRLASRDLPGVSDEERDRLAQSWRRWKQASDALDTADEAEEFQAVGMRCREAMLALVREIATDEMVPEGKDPPKRGDFIHWSEHIADTISPGRKSSYIRKYLKANAKATWELVQWLTHAANATRIDGSFAVNATLTVIGAYGTALVRYERGEPDRCPECSSYRLTSIYRPETNAEPAYATLCEVCGWEDTSRAQPSPLGG